MIEALWKSALNVVAGLVLSSVGSHDGVILSLGLMVTVSLVLVSYLELRRTSPSQTRLRGSR